MTGAPLARRLGLFSAVVIVVSGMVGGGIFVNPYLVAARLGGAGEGPLLGVWIAGGALALCGAFVFAELSTVVPRVGGQYAFFREAFHPAVGFLYGWTLLLLVNTASLAAMAVVLAEHLLAMLAWPPAWAGPLAVTILLALTAYHALGVRPGALLLDVLTTTKIVAIAALIVAALASRGAPTPAAAVVAPTWPGPSALLAALVPVMFAYGGWQNLNHVAEEVRDPLRTLPRAALLGVVLVIAIYVGINAAYLHVLSAPGLARTHTPAADVAAAVWGPAGGRLVGGVIALSIFGFLNLALLSAPRVYYAMAADGLFFGALARVHPRFHTPVAAIALQGGMAAAMALSATYGALVSLAVFGDWVFFALAGVALVRLRRTRPDAVRTFPAPAYPLTPAVFTLSGVLLLANQFLVEPRGAALAAATIAAGVPAYLMWARRRRP